MTKNNLQVSNFPSERPIYHLHFDNPVKIRDVYNGLVSVCGINYQGDPEHIQNCGVSLYIMERQADKKIIPLASLVIDLPGFNHNPRELFGGYRKFKAHTYTHLIDHSHNLFNISGDHRVTKEAVEEVRRRFS